MTSDWSDGANTTASSQIETREDPDEDEFRNQLHTAYAAAATEGRKGEKAR